MIRMATESSSTGIDRAICGRWMPMVISPCIPAGSISKICWPSPNSGRSTNFPGRTSHQRRRMVVTIRRLWCFRKVHEGLDAPGDTQHAEPVLVADLAQGGIVVAALAKDGEQV